MKKIITILMILMMFTTLCACSSKTNEEVVETPEEVVEEVVKRDDLKILSPLPPETLDQDVSVGTAVVLRNLYANLYRLDSNNNIVEELAEGYSVNDDFTVYTFTLKDNLLFSDGSKLTAEDVKYTYERGITNKIEYFEVIKSIEVLDEKTVVITLYEPNNYFLSNMTEEHMCVMSKAAIEGGMDVANLPTVTSGAYTLASWDKENKTMELKANPNFVLGEPDIKNVTIYYSLDGSIHEALANGTIDYAANISNDSGEIPYLKVAKGIDLIPYDNRSWNFITLNQTHDHFADVNVRKAIVSALDLDYIISTAIDGQGTPAPLIITSGITGYLPGFNDSPYDLKAAKDYMAASNYPDGFKMTLEIADDSGANVAEAVKTLLKEINIDVEIARIDGNQLLDNLFDASYDASFVSYSMYSGHISHAIPLFAQGDLNICYSNSGKIGDLMQKSLAVDSDERDALLSEAYTLMREEWPYVGLYWITVFDAKVEGLEMKEPVTSEKYVISNMYWN